ncbi:MAG: Uma2 family endonuclease [Blastocatellia bacterium]
MQPVSTSPLVRKYTLKEFWALPEPKDGTKFELIAGVLYMSPPPRYPHHVSWSVLNRLLIMHLAEIEDRGMVFAPQAALWTSTDTYVEPDLFYISARSLKSIDLRQPDRADLVIEIISPSTAIYDRNTKADTYAALGVRELWMVDPENETVEVRNLKRGSKTYGSGQVFKRGQRVQSKVLPGFSPAVTAICKH